MTPDQIFERFEKLVNYTYELKIPADARQSKIEAVWRVDALYLAKAFVMLNIQSEEIHPHLKGVNPQIGRIYIGMTTNDEVTVSITCDYDRMYTAYRASDKIKYLTDVDNATSLKVWAKYQELKGSIGDDPGLLDILDI